MPAVVFAFALMLLTGVSPASAAAVDNPGRSRQCAAEWQSLKGAGRAAGQSRSDFIAECLAAPASGIVSKCKDGSMSRGSDPGRACASHGGVAQRFGI
jgi:hypothetical protein